MDKNRHGKNHGGSAFLWGFILGAIFATLLTTKKGRAILRELIDLGTELIEDFLEQRKNKSFEKKIIETQKAFVKEEKENVMEAVEDLNSEIGASETVVSDKTEVKSAEEEIVIDEVSLEAQNLARKVAEMEKHTHEGEEPKKRGSKRRLFRGIRKTKAN